MRDLEREPEPGPGVRREHGDIITVTTPAGISATGTFDRYTYQQQPTITKLSVKAGSARGGTSVIVTGTAFTGATNVSFGASSVAHFTVNSPTSITAESLQAAPASST